MNRFYVTLVLLLVGTLIGTSAWAQPAVIIPGPIPTLTANCTIQRNAGNTDWTCSASSAATQPLTDSAGLMADNVDSSKVLFLQLSGLSTATTRTWTIPDANITFPTTIASLAANTFTGLQTMNGGFSGTTGVLSSTFAVTGVATFTAIPVFTAGLGSTTVTGTLTVAPTANGTIATLGYASGLRWFMFSDASTRYMTSATAGGGNGIFSDATLSGLVVGGAGILYSSATDTTAIGRLGVSGTSNTFYNSLSIRNTNVGNAAVTNMQIGNDGSALIGGLAGFGSGYATSGLSIADSISLYASTAGGLTLIATNGSGDVRIGSRNVLAITVGAGQVTKFGGTAARATTEGTNHIDIFDGTAPVGTLANGVSFYSTTGEARVMDAAGNATLLSPHDQVTNEWIYWSKDTRNGKVLRIDMERLMRRLDQQFGGGYVTETVEPLVTAVEQAAIDKRAAEAAIREAAQKVKDTEAVKGRLAAEIRQAIRARLASCDADNAVIVAQGGKAESCEKSDADRAERKAMQSEAAAAKVKADADAAGQRKAALAACVALNAKITAAGGKARACAEVIR